MLSSKYGKVLTVILIIAILAIVGLLIFLGIDWYRAYVTGADASEMVEEINNYLVDVGNSNQQNNTQNYIEQPNIDINTNIVNEPSNKPSGNSSGSSKKTLKYKGFNVVGKIEIPTTKIELPILEKVTTKSIEASVGVLYGPGVNKVGNTVLVGHNYRNGTFFSNNSKLAIGDKIYITDIETGTRRTYIIYRKYNADANEFDYAVRDTKGKREISLSTCTTDSRYRLVIWAKEE